MKKLFVSLVLACVTCAGVAQVVIPAGTSLNITSVAVAPSGGTPAYGPGSSTNNAWALWDGTAGNLLKNSNVTYSSPTLSVPASFAIAGAGTTVDILTSSGQNARFSTTHLLLGGRTADGIGVVQLPAATTSAGGITLDTLQIYQKDNINLYINSTAGGPLLTLLNTGVPTLIFGALGSQPYFQGLVGGQDFLIQSAAAAGVLLKTNGGTTALTLDSSQNATFGGQILRFATTKGIQGSNTNDNVSAGYVGEYIESLVPVGSAVSLTTNTATNITTISLTAGDWDVEGNMNFALTGATTTSFKAGISSTSATLPTDGSEIYSAVVTTVLTDTETLTNPRKRFSLSGTTTVYLIAQSTFSVGTEAVFGKITARRVR